MYDRPVRTHNADVQPYDATARASLERLEEWLWSEAFGSVPAVRDVAAWVCELSDLYTLERGVLAKRQGDRGHVAAKSLYFLASDAPKVMLALAECAARDGRFAAPSTIVDVGCGVGATSVGALLWLAGRGQRRVTIWGIDHEPSVLAAWAATVRQAAAIVGVEATLHTYAADGLERELPEETSLVLCQTALNERLAGNRAGELDHDQATVDAVARWARSVPTLLIEPALKVTTRALQRLRDRLLRSEPIEVVAPCPHQGPCPMLGNERDWCHESRRIEPTSRGAAIQALTRRRDALALSSFLALAPRGLAIRGLSSRGLGQPDSSDGRLWRLVSDPLGSRGKTERWTCRSDGVLRLVRVLDRERSDENTLLVDAERGTLVRLPVLPNSDRIAPTDRVELALATGDHESA